MRPVRDVQEPSRQSTGGTGPLSGSGETHQWSPQDSNETLAGAWTPEVSSRLFGDLIVSSACVIEDHSAGPARPAGDLEGGPHTRRSTFQAHRLSVLTRPTTFGFFGPRTDRNGPAVLSIGRWAPSHIEPAYSSESAGAGRVRNDSGCRPLSGSLPRAAAPRGPRTTGAKRKLSYGVKTIFCPASLSGSELFGVSDEAVGDAGQKIVSARRVWGCEAGGVPTHVVTVVRTSSVHGSSSIEE